MDYKCSLSWAATDIFPLTLVWMFFNGRATSLNSTIDVPISAISPTWVPCGYRSNFIVIQQYHAVTIVLTTSWSQLRHATHINACVSCCCPSFSSQPFRDVKHKLTCLLLCRFFVGSGWGLIFLQHRPLVMVANLPAFYDILQLAHWLKSVQDIWHMIWWIRSVIGESNCCLALALSAAAAA